MIFAKKKDMVIAKRIMGVLLLGGMTYLGYIKLKENSGTTEYAGFYVFFLVVILFLIFLAIRKILTY